MPRGFCWFWLTAPYWYPYFQRFWRLYPWPPWWIWSYGPTRLYAWPFMTREQEKMMLEQQVEILESQLEAIRKRLEELKKQLAEEKIKIAFPTKNSKGLEDVVSEVFGKAEYFTIIDLVKGSVGGVETLKNPASSFKHGAGPIAVKTLVDIGVKIVGAGELGIGVLELLEQSGVRYFRVQPGITVKDAVKTVLAEMEERPGVS